MLLCAFTAFRRRSRGQHVEPLEAEAGPVRSVPPPALYAAVDCAARGGFGAAAGHHQSPVAERGRHSLPLDSAAQPVPAELHPLLRRQRLVPAQSYLQLLAVAIGSMAYALGVDTTGNLPILVLVPLFCLGLFTCCMVCHGELARLKPAPAIPDAFLS